MDATEPKPQRGKRDPFAGKPRPFLKPHKFHPELHRVKSLLRDLRLETVCEQAKCPNISECFARPTATFMILGRDCTRKCVFCGVGFSAQPLPPESDEPQRIAEAAQRLQLKHIVYTSVARDDLPDEGAHHFADCVAAVRQTRPLATVEILTPDFKRDPAAALGILSQAPPDIFNHNVETISRLQKYVRPYASYATSLALLEKAARLFDRIPIKSGLMVGLGETLEEIKEALDDLRKAGATHLTVGQYFQPSRKHTAVQKYYSQESFDEMKTFALGLGFIHVASGPYVRSSYFAEAGLEPKEPT